MRFARLELTLARATIARRYRVSHDHDDVGVDIGPRPAAPVRVRLDRRQ
jgi:cytochrome P450